MAEFSFEDLLPMSLNMGPPLPRFLGVTWPWYKPELPPGEYECPYCQEVFGTFEEMVSHIQSEHPGERIPLPIEWE